MTNQELSAKIFEGLATEEEFAAAVGRDVRTVRRWFAAGLPSIKRGRLRLIPIERANAWLRGESQKPKRGRPRTAS